MQNAGVVYSRIKTRFALSASCLGVGFISAWTELSYINPPLPYWHDPEFLFRLFDAGTIAFAVAIALAARFGKLSRTLVANNRNLVLTCGLLIASTCVNFGSVALGLSNVAVLSVSAIVGGMGLTLLFVMWFEVLSHLNPIQLLLCYALAAIGRVLIIWLCSGMTMDRLWACLCFIALCSVLTLAASRETFADKASAAATLTSEHSGASSPGEERCSFPLKPLMVVVTGTLVLSFVLRIIGNTWGTNGNPGVIVAGAGVALLVLRMGNSFEFKWLWKASLAFIVLTVISFVLWNGASPMLSGVFACISYELCLMLMYSILGNLVFRNFYNSTFLFSTELAVALTAGHIGNTAASWIIEFPAENGIILLVVVTSVLALLFTVVCMWTFSRQSLEDTWGVVIKQPLANDMDLLLEKSRLGLRCHELAQNAGLSRREEEVLLLLAYKKKPAVIAEKLFIEVSTVNTHKKNVYRKLGVHSAKQLQARIGTIDDGVDPLA